MKISLEWLSEFVEIPTNVEDILTNLGMNVEEVLEPFAKGRILAGKVRKATTHPSSDRLLVCDVDVGEKVLKIVTGDLRIKEGDVVAVALPGSILANGNVIKEVEIKGIASEGMMCSLAELGLEEESDRVYVFDEDIPPGTDLVELLKLNDKVLDIEITPNRGDLLSYLGVAREIAAKTKKELKLPEVSFEVPDEKTKDLVSVVIEDKDGCKRYAAGMVLGVKVGESPLWIKRRLMASGIRPINNVVDVTNYVLLELGHPIHAFDYHLIKSKRVVVRKARKGERVVLLDEKEYELGGIETLITDGGEEIIAVGGVMGAQNSGINEATKDVLVEVAWFDPVRIRKTSKRLSLQTDASYRFERVVDFEDTIRVMKTALQLIQKVAGGRITDGIVDVVVEKPERPVVTLRKKKIKEVLGIEVPESEVEEILKGLEFEIVDKGEQWQVKVPSHRIRDVYREADLIEEIGRVYGYDKVPSERTLIWSGLGGWNERQGFRREMVSLMKGLGYDEVVTFSFTSSKKVEGWKFRNVKTLKVLNPITDELDVMRESLAYTLMEVLSYNWTHQVRDVRIFEIGKVFWDEEGPKEEERIGAMAIGFENPGDYTDPRKVSFYRIKGDVDEILERVGVNGRFERTELAGFVPTATARILVGDEEIGIVGMIDPDICRRYDVKSDVYYFELSLEKLFKLRKRAPEYTPSPAFPSIRRDVALLIGKETRSSDVIALMRELGGELLESVGIMDVYRGEGVPEGMISVTFSLIFRSSERTLKDEEVNDLLEKILKGLEERLGVKRRF